MAKKKQDNKQYEEIDGVNYEIKNPLRKNIVRVYQDNVRNAHADYVAKHRMVEKRKRYADLLLKNIERAPFVLGWLQWPEKKEEDKGLTKGSKKKKKPTKTRVRKGSSKKP